MVVKHDGNLSMRGDIVQFADAARLYLNIRRNGHAIQVKALRSWAEIKSMIVTDAIKMISTAQVCAY